jgi:glutaminase
MFKDDNEHLVLGKFLSKLADKGVKKKDPRLKTMIGKLKSMRIQSDENFESLILDRDLFKLLIKENVELISRGIHNQFVIPDFNDFCKYVEEFYWKCKANKSGKVADYIPQLAKYNPGYFHLCFLLRNDQVHRNRGVAPPRKTRSVRVLEFFRLHIIISQIIVKKIFSD